MANLFLPLGITLQETNISPQNAILKMIFLFPRWDMLIPWRVHILVGKLKFTLLFHRPKWLSKLYFFAIFVQGGPLPFIKTYNPYKWPKING